MSELDAYFEQQYNNRAAVPEHGVFIQSWLQRSEAYRAQASAAVLNQAYGDAQREVMDIFPLARKRAPVHIFIHGGYWQALNKDSFSFLAEVFNRQGECAVILNYGLCPAVSIAQISQQIYQALIWVYRNIEHFGADPHNMQISGHSAGGHLLATLLTRDWSEWGLQQAPLKRMNALSGLYDLRPLLQTSINQALGLDLQSALDNSPLLHTIDTSHPDLQLNLLVGELESDEYKRQSLELFEQWQRHFSMHNQIAGDTHHFSILDAFVEHFYRPLDPM